MRYLQVAIPVIAGVMSIACGLAAASGTTPTRLAVDSDIAPHGEKVPIIWQHRKMTFNYTGFTTSYECDALESKVGKILIYFGARSDVKIRADCPRGPNVPSHEAWVNAEFDVPQRQASPIPGPLNGLHYISMPGIPTSWTAAIVNSYKR